MSEKTGSNFEGDAIYEGAIVGSAEEVNATHDQLPDVESYKASVGIRGSQRKSPSAGEGGCNEPSTVLGTGRGTRAERTLEERHYKSLVCIATSLLCVLAWVVVLAVVLTYNFKDEANHKFNPNHPDKQWVKPDDSRIEDFRVLLLQYGYVQSPALLNDMTSAQYKAMEWIADYDDFKVEASISTDFVERYVLAVLYYSWNGPKWNYNCDFLSAKHVCDWKHFFVAQTEGDNGGPVQQKQIPVGVFCNDDNDPSTVYRTVNVLSLPTNNMEGTIPIEIGLLENLSEIDLFNNFLHGTIPDELVTWGTRTNLLMRSIKLHNNDFEGSFPSFVHKLINLETLNLADNEFTGSFPTEDGKTLSMAFSLAELNVNKNKMEGRLDALMNMSALTNLQLDSNQFSGTLSDELLQSWNKLVVFDAGNNHIDGSLPRDLFASSILEIIDLHKNDLIGELPRIEYFNSPLTFLALQDNQLSGSMDPVFELRNLQHLDMSTNSFNGTITNRIGDMANLRYLFLAYNPYLDNASIPTEIGQLTQLVDLSLQNTNRMGLIPATNMGKMSNLVLLDLSDNDLSGQLPEQLSELTNLRFILVQDNSKMQGSIPAQYTEKLSNLDTIAFIDTNINGGEETLCNRIKSLQTLASTCNEAMLSNTDTGLCSCCTCCLSPSDSMYMSKGFDQCSDISYFSEVDPVEQYEYSRSSYYFPGVSNDHLNDNKTNIDDSGDDDSGDDDSGDDSVDDDILGDDEYYKTLGEVHEGG